MPENLEPVLEDFRTLTRLGLFSEPSSRAPTVAFIRSLLSLSARQGMAPFDPSILQVQDCHDADTLTALLSLLLEPTPELHSLLVPSVLLRLTAEDTPPQSFSHVIDTCEYVIGGWTWEEKGGFINGHPMIGEIKGGLSGKEQGGATRPVVLARWAGPCHCSLCVCTH